MRASEQVRRYEPPGTCARAGLAANGITIAAPAIAAALTPPIRLRMMSLLLSSVNMTNSAERGSCSHDVAPRYPKQGRFPARTRIMNQAPSTGGAMPHPPSPDDRRAGPRLAISLLVFSALMLSALPLARAAEPEASVETAPTPGAGPLSPVRREAPAAAQSTSSKQTPVAKKPTITMPAPATTPAADAGASSPPPAAKPPPKQAEHASSVASSVTKATKPQQTQAQEATPPRPHRKQP